MMKKQLKTLILCLVIVAVLAAAYFIVSALIPKDEKETDSLHVISGEADPMFAVKVEFPASKNDGYRYIIGKVPQPEEAVLYVSQAV